MPAFLIALIGLPWYILAIIGVAVVLGVLGLIALGEKIIKFLLGFLVPALFLLAIFYGLYVYVLAPYVK